ncbi:DNA polymerase III subunit gamma/tau [Campylobacter fetus]|uniref:DNA polymerase III subunit gamma/tau n=1 Tax=Campylobacter fetus TaxID=196 RepID=A0A5L8QMU0_CAMFE|nr:DNA polymerase III subunit gamma/tau [Campylobacter fetus]EAI4415115.1 DNA polymerase III subunit gamma/tau [Campylobacter fetus]EAI5407637.1 DNA polymerase III subunit gamma/tau [Campylobacter fetus]EAJ0327327.1 DNA polymerase III subunit gamma/tau [Campylobacter fetus]EAJ1230643.1 DNA polymerase III subunit gamma/tau [Campylobacter fetus]EAK0416101.1 DNA polymerase III subunit gamma/tau [Campylobacter fetus]
MKALALKYRPKSFDELIGQDIVANSLSHALNSGRIGHAYLFSGLRGSGKTSSARIFAKALLCEQGIGSHPCEICANCVMANEGRHLDIIEMDAASHRKIDDIRELIEHTKYSPSSARFKIFIIDEVHMLTREAFNALLKTLEEPPEYVKFILATTDPLKLPATILSRTQHFRFKPISKHDILKHLEFIMNKEGIKFEPKALEILSRSGSGSLRDTLTLLDQAIIFSHEFVTQKAVADMLGLLDPSKIEEVLSIVASRDRNALLNLLKELSGSDAELIIDELIINLKDKFINQNSEFSILIFERFFRILSEAKSMLGSGSDSEFTLYIALFMMLEAFNLTDINDAINENLAPKPISISNVLTPKPAQIIPQKPAQKSPYEMFVAGIYDRDYELGKCFDECIEFVDFSDNSLILSSNANGQNQEILRKSSKIILEILRKIFGKDAKIQIKKADEPKSVEEKVTSGMQKLLATSVNLEVSKNDVEPTNLEANLQNTQTPAKDPAKISLDNIKNDENSALKSNIKELSRLFGEPEIIKNDY